MCNNKFPFSPFPILHECVQKSKVLIILKMLVYCSISSKFSYNSSFNLSQQLKGYAVN